jgi:hypothetical protein
MLFVFVMRLLSRPSRDALTHPARSQNCPPKGKFLRLRIHLLAKTNHAIGTDTKP